MTDEVIIIAHPEHSSGELKHAYLSYLKISWHFIFLNDLNFWTKINILGTIFKGTLWLFRECENSNWNRALVSNMYIYICINACGAWTRYWSPLLNIPYATDVLLLSIWIWGLTIIPSFCISKNLNFRPIILLFKICRHTESLNCLALKHWKTMKIAGITQNTYTIIFCNFSLYHHSFR